MSESQDYHSNRILKVDALRGFALCGIMLLHHIERFNLFRRAQQPIEWFAQFDGVAHDVMFVLFLNKSYSIFSLLFGFGFWMQYQKWTKLGYGYTWRFGWRMVLLFAFGLSQCVFYSGDILIFYAVMSFPLLLFRKASDRVVLWVSILLLLSPLELYYFVQSIVDSNYAIPKLRVSNMRAVMDSRTSGSFWEVLQLNFEFGIRNTWTWMWNNFRFFQTPGLFLLGMYFGRKRLFALDSVRFWSRFLLLSLGGYIALVVGGNQLSVWMDEGSSLSQGQKILGFYDKLAFTFVLISAIFVCWPLMRRGLSVFAPYGKMSLTNYLLQALVGTFLYYGWGLGLHEYCGPALCVLIGFSILILQMIFSWWWLQRYKQGPCEWLWRRLTWLGKSK